MKLTWTPKDKIPYGTKRTKTKFLWFPRVLRPTEEPNNTLVFKWLCRASWVEVMKTWKSQPPESRPMDVYGWKAEFWLD